MENLLNIKKFQRIVTSIVDECLECDSLSENNLEEISQFLDNSSLKNIAEERALLKKCGYPLCSIKLHYIKEQKYKIYANRVFDVTDRKYFCSDYCYNSFLHLEKQLPTEPLWITGNRKRFAVNFMKRNYDIHTQKKIRPGIEVTLDPAAELAEALQELKILDDSEKKEPKTFAKVEEISQKPSPKIKSVEICDVSGLKGGSFLLNDNDDELDELFSTHSTNFDYDSDKDDLRMDDVDKDNLCGWSSKTPINRHLPSERNLDIIRKKYFVENKKGLSLKKRPPPSYIEPKAFPKNISKEKE